MNILKYISILILFGFLMGCASVDDNTPYKGFTAEKLYASGEQALLKGDYSDAVKYYETLSTRYPFGKYAAKGQLHIIYAYYKNGDYASAAAAASRYVHVYPRSAHVDYAYYMRGLSNLYQNTSTISRYLKIDTSKRDLTSARQAFYDFRDLAELFPNSKYTPAAHQYMIHIRNMFAQHELTVAEYYFAHKAYVAASNRASYIVQNYHRSPQVKDALIMLIKANRQLGLTKSADDAFRVLRANYPQAAVKSLA